MEVRNSNIVLLSFWLGLKLGAPAPARIMHYGTFFESIQAVGLFVQSSYDNQGSLSPSFSTLVSDKSSTRAPSMKPPCVRGGRWVDRWPVLSPANNRIISPKHTTFVLSSAGHRDVSQPDIPG